MKTVPKKERILSVATENRTRSNQIKLQLGIRGNILATRTMKNWSQLSGDGSLQPWRSALRWDKMRQSVGNKVQTENSCKVSRRMHSMTIKSPFSLSWFCKIRNPNVFSSCTLILLYFFFLNCMAVYILTAVHHSAMNSKMCNIIRLY